MRNRYRTAVLAACGAFVVTQPAAGLVSAQRPVMPNPSRSPS